MASAGSVISNAARNEYNRDSTAAANAERVLLGGGYQFGVVATRHIPAGAEVLVHYGVQHWLDLLPPLPTSTANARSGSGTGEASVSVDADEAPSLARVRSEVVERMASRILSFDFEPSVPLVRTPLPADAIDQMSQWGLTKFRIDPKLCDEVLREAEATFAEAEAHPLGLSGSPLYGQIRDRSVGARRCNSTDTGSGLNRLFLPCPKSTLTVP